MDFSFLSTVCGHLHVWYVLKMPCRAKGNYKSGKFQSFAGLGWRMAIRGLFICHMWLLPLEILGFGISDGGVRAKRDFLSQSELQKTQTINNLLGKLIFSESHIYLKGNLG